jgi:hypothetical protein
MFHFIASGVRLYLDGTISILVKSETFQVVTHKIDKCFFFAIYMYFLIFNCYQSVNTNTFCIDILVHGSSAECAYVACPRFQLCYWVRVRQMSGSLVKEHPI